MKHRLIYLRLTMTGPLKGLAAIPTGSNFARKQLTVIDNVAYIAWASDSPVVKIPLGTDTFFRADGKIRIHTVADYRINL